MKGCFDNFHFAFSKVASTLPQIMDLFVELEGLLKDLREHGVPYALCGGFALSVYGIVRATEDLDLMVSPEGLPAFRRVVRTLGFIRENPPMELASGRVIISRFLKFGLSEDDFVIVDVLHVTPAVGEAWQTRVTVNTDLGSVVVVSRDGLIGLKRLRSSAVDLSDIAQLEEGP